MCGAQHSMCMNICIRPIYIHTLYTYSLIGEDESGQYERARQGAKRLTHAVTLENPEITRGCSRPHGHTVCPNEFRTKNEGVPDNDDKIISTANE